ncbi:hypothetical protein DCS_08076 [Drechmeria coniospora]|uniref:Uncharacterized protein n=1 Tax=Drechmeria coniospora TaxID=98403 RepID=A0A151GG82_DRECN|nr:hypothetical protein DCS_08076 [Drechmeria coniospora]KYK56110.1 hypothetical protein DCS_08076 [Drechmeria coniospora]
MDSCRRVAVGVAVGAEPPIRDLCQGERTQDEETKKRFRLMHHGFGSETSDNDNTGQRYSAHAHMQQWPDEKGGPHCCPGHVGAGTPDRGLRAPLVLPRRASLAREPSAGKRATNTSPWATTVNGACHQPSPPASSRGNGDSRGGDCCMPIGLGRGGIEFPRIAGRANDGAAGGPAARARGHEQGEGPAVSRRRSHGVATQRGVGDAQYCGGQATDQQAEASSVGASPRDMRHVP